MKTAILIAVAFVFLSSLPLFAHPSVPVAQQNTTLPTRANESGNAQASHDSTTSAASEATMRSVHADLVRRLDSKSAETGGAVAAKARKNLRTDATHAKAHAE